VIEATMQDAGYSVGRAAVRLLLARIAGQAQGESGSPVHEVLQPSLVIRASCAPFSLQ
jgi:DNA-binding LacI/PurR family transcriptional regulator